MKEMCMAMAIVMLLPGVNAFASPAEQHSDADLAQAESPSPGYVFDVMKSDNNKSAADADRPPAESQGNESPSPAYVFDAMKPGNDKPVKDGKPAAPRRFLDVFYGSVTTSDDTVSAYSKDFCLIFCGPPSYYSQQADFRSSSVFGVRIGGWLKDYPAIGLAADFSYLRADAPGVPDPSFPGAYTTGVSIWYMPISFVLLARSSFLRSESTPEGRMQLYGGLMLAWVIGDIKVNGVGGTTDSNFGLGALLGAAWHFPSFALFGEYRMMNASLSYDSSDSDFSFDNTTASADLDSKQAVFGVSFKY